MGSDMTVLTPSGAIHRRRRFMNSCVVEFGEHVRTLLCCVEQPVRHQISVNKSAGRVTYGEFFLLDVVGWQIELQVARRQLFSESASSPYPTKVYEYCARVQHVLIALKRRIVSHSGSAAAAAPKMRGLVEISEKLLRRYRRLCQGFALEHSRGERVHQAVLDLFHAWNESARFAAERNGRIGKLRGGVDLSRFGMPLSDVVEQLALGEHVQLPDDFFCVMEG